MGRTEGSGLLGITDKTNEDLPTSARSATPAQAYPPRPPVNNVGTRPSVEQLYLQYRRYVGSIGLRFLGDTVDLEDLIQAVFVDVLKCIDQLNDVTSVKAWISTIASRRAYRMRETNSRLALGCDYARVAAPHLSAAKHRRMEPTRVALSLIPAPQRLLCSLRYTEGWTLAELARRYTCSLATIKRRLHDARRAVAAQTIILNQHRKI